MPEPAPTTSPHAIVVGAGIAGIATAIRLAVKGYAVSVYEANAYPGGKLTAFEQDGFRFDAGPSLFTLPELVDELFTLAGQNPKDYFNYHRLEVACHYFYEDGKRIQGYSDPARFAAEVESVLGVPAQVVRRHLEKAAFKYEMTRGIFLERSLHRLSTYTTRDFFRGLANIWRLHLLPSMHKVNARSLRHPKLVQLFDRYATYNGSNPYAAPGILNLIPHFEHNLGAAFPKGGMHAITQSLVRLSEDLGVVFHYNAPVARILVADKAAQGVRVGDKDIAADLVVSNADIVPTYRRLLPDQKAPERILQHPRSSSALIFYWGIRDIFPDLRLHNIFFSADYAAEFKTIFQDHTVGEDPTVYVNISSKEAAADAPEGMENWFVMINVPGNTGQDWDALIAQARKDILAKLSRMLGREIAPLIVTEDVLDPRLIETRTSSFGGSLYGASSNSRMSAFLRHANYTGRLKKLYFCGGSVHPGGGIPLCLHAAAIVSDMIDPV